MQVADTLDFKQIQTSTPTTRVVPVQPTTPPPSPTPSETDSEAYTLTAASSRDAVSDCATLASIDNIFPLLTKIDAIEEKLPSAISHQTDLSSSSVASSDDAPSVDALLQREEEFDAVQLDVPAQPEPSIVAFVPEHPVSHSDSFVKNGEDDVHATGAVSAMTPPQDESHDEPRASVDDER